jgi:hypothetical protein
MRDDFQDREEQEAIVRSPLVRFLGIHLLLGAAIGVAVVSLAVLLNVAGLRDLLLETEDQVVPLVLLYSFNAITFANVSMGVGIMTMRAD